MATSASVAFDESKFGGSMVERGNEVWWPAWSEEEEEEEEHAAQAAPNQQQAGAAAADGGAEGAQEAPAAVGAADEAPAAEAAANVGAQAQAEPAAAAAADGGGEQQKPRRSERMRKEPDRFVAGVAAKGAAAGELPVPTSLAEALGGPESEQWKEACEEEIRALQEHCVFRLEVPPKGQKVLPLKWVFTRKYGADGSVERYKARLVAKGFMQVEGVNVFEVYAPTSQASTLRALFAVAAAQGMHVHHVDVRTAFIEWRARGGGLRAWSSRRGFPWAAKS